MQLFRSDTKRDVTRTQQRLVGTEATAHQDAAGNAALDKNTRRHSGALWPPSLDQDKNDQEYESEHKRCHDTAVAPLHAVSG